MKKITTTDELYRYCEDGRPHDFFISFGIARSSKTMTMTADGDYAVFNAIDGSEDVLTEHELYSQSNIGEAMTNGAFYTY